MAMKLEKENVRIIFMKLLDNMEHYGLEGKDAEHQSCYIAGALDMAEAVMEAIGELGGEVMAELKPCPFCGCRFPKIAIDGVCDYYYYVRRPVCGARTASDMLSDEAERNWNKRC